ncbi:ras family-domain-containing protein, partial [Lactifluus subvellereus]
MKYIIIGSSLSFTCSWYLFHGKELPTGEAGTGKSCLLHHFTNNSFKPQSQHTIGVEFSSRTVKLGEKRIKLQLWDIAGQERLRSVGQCRDLISL